MVVAGYQTVRRVDFGEQMPRYESAMAVTIGLSERIAKGSLGPLHVPELA